MSATEAEATTMDHEADDLVIARRVLRLESEALAALAAALGESFVAAVDCLDAVAGRIIVSGMGKSGHVARKIAATLASTGSPAVFVHPGEASHGDLGMITESDAVVVLSNSGRTPELNDLVAYSRRFAIPLLAIIGRAGSQLAESADVALELPPVPEACPLGLAPTTSTTAMLALGDALAVALLERKDFSSDQFHALHPGGQLGSQLLKVRDLMHEGEAIPLATPETRMADAILIMSQKSFGCVGIVAADGSLVGIVTDGDLRRHMADDLLGRSAAEIMTPAPKTIAPQALAAEALGRMNQSSITSLFVVEAGAVVGLLHLHDLLRAGVV
ncbi:MAG: KpsF/GutQ family sugar-phosphate isomerase [Alphaproteobacteria bacterium]|jgi:arabinose-5-phosphate isomerase|nr:KpsF/GutQ family sugar-phosphate isomerase [Alphaproteobacteria bacterium]MDP6621921.1 KpsF/GutQ family sugar-phosphate isomerase [Alphaproteobacteria bacterium]